MIGMDVRLCNGMGCVRMFPQWALIFDSLASFIMCFFIFILYSVVHTSFKCRLRSYWLGIVYKFITYLKEQIAIATFTISKDAQIMSLSRNLVQCLHRFLIESAMLLAT